MKRLFIAAALPALCLLSFSACRETVPPPAEEVQLRAEDWISQLSLEEKASLMTHTSPAVDRLGIPAYNWWNEALHGVARNGRATTFPQPIGMAASFDAPLLETVFTAVSDEARIKHRLALQEGESGQYQGLTFWTPNINIFRDPRWGRGMETYGEDPYLTGQLGMAVVRGLQGPPDAPVRKAHACAKHFAVHSGPERIRHSFDAVVSERDLRETYLPAFKDLVVKAGVEEVMVAYNRFRGVPCGANTYLIDTLLRGEWGYQGLVTSDCWAICDFYKPGYHGYSPDAAHAAAAAVRAGTDLNCGVTYQAIPEAVRSGLLDEADVDRSLERLLAARIRLGEIDGDPGSWGALDEDLLESSAHRALAREMARESLVLLWNRDGVLPLDAAQRIALIGPNADAKELLWGNYNPIPSETVTLLDAFRQRIPELVHFPGCGLLDEAYCGVPEMDPDTLLKQLDGIDIVVFAGGISPRLEGEALRVELPGFLGGDRTDLELPQVQRRLLRTLHEAGKKVVLVNFSGSAIGLEPETETCDAILQAWYPGEQGGAAIADILFGEVSPSGKLPVTFYRNVSQLPDFEDYSMRNRTYRYFEGDPLFPFGYGLSYTSFRYGRAKVKKDRILLPVTNTGTRDGVEVVQLYVRRPEDTTGPKKSLRGFCRVAVPAGGTVEAVLPLTEETFLGWSEEKGDMIPLPGDWELLYGGRSDELQSVSLKRK